MTQESLEIMMRPTPALLKNWKADLEVRDHELTALKDEVETYKNQNEGLQSTVSSQKGRYWRPNWTRSKAKQDEVAKLQDQVNQLITKSTLDQGEGVTSPGLRPLRKLPGVPISLREKRKSSRKDAIALYKLALDFGKEEAQARNCRIGKEDLKWIIYFI